MRRSGISARNVVRDLSANIVKLMNYRDAVNQSLRISYILARKIFHELTMMLSQIEPDPTKAGYASIETT